MPAIITHHLFGVEVYEKLDALIGRGGAAKDAFLLGNQGPDPLLCLKALPSAVGFRGVGSLMHTTKPARLFDALHGHLVTGGSDESSRVQRAFALGFLCHYLLDSTVHPLVYAQQHAICASGVQGLSPAQAGRIVHALIETELDEYALTAKFGTTVETFRPHIEILKCREWALLAISNRLAPVALDAYDLAMPGFAFVTSVHLYRAAQHAIDARRENPALPLEIAQMTGDPYTHFKALTHSAIVRKRTDFANVDHVPWKHPFIPGAVVQASFDELYASAYERALVVLPSYAQLDFGAIACEQLTCGVNFYGDIVEKTSEASAG